MACWFLLCYFVGKLPRVLQGVGLEFVQKPSFALGFFCCPKPTFRRKAQSTIYSKNVGAPCKTLLEPYFHTAPQLANLVEQHPSHGTLCLPLTQRRHTMPWQRQTQHQANVHKPFCCATQNLAKKVAKIGWVCKGFATLLANKTSRVRVRSYFLY